MENLKRPYEISLWEDILTFVVDNEGTVTEYEGSLESAVGQVKAQYYKERRICTIGSNTMDTPIRAHEPSLVSNVNGSNTLTFKMYSSYWDDDAEDFRDNPFIDFLVNERKIKLRVDEEADVKWYDFIIKNIEQDSESKVFTYTAIDIFINELSKSGFNLEFDSELGNNMGTITDLGKKVLDESDWSVKEEGNDLIRQYIEEPLYEIIVKDQITAKDMISGKEIVIPASSESSTIKIYGFYNCIVNNTPYFQFLYSENGQYEVDDNYVIVSQSNWYIDNVTYPEENLPSFGQTMTISEKYRGKRLVRKIQTTYDATIDKYVAVYEFGGEEVYGYVETDYLSPASVRSFVTNGSNFTSTTGWNVSGESEGDSGVILPELSVVTVPDIQDIDGNSILDGEEIKEGALKTYLKWSPTLKLVPKDGAQGLVNTGIADHRQYIENFTEGEEYVLRIKYSQQDQIGAHGAKTLKASDENLKIIIGEYTVSEGKYTVLEENTYFEGIIEPAETFSDYAVVKMSCEKSLDYTSMIEKPHLGLIIIPMGAETLYFEEVQFFKYYQKNESSEDFLPPDELGEGKVVNTYYYYYPNSEYKSIKDVKYIYTGNKPAAYAELYNEDFEKIRSITAKESNRFNLIQDLCEIFECWARFEIEHNEDGSIKLDDNYRPLKWVSFHEYIGKENFAGFKYGINLKQIQRTIDSDTIASKVIVKNNSNEFGKNGFCSIARAEENPCGENFILDFSYYIQQQMLGLAELTNDLYLEVNGYIGYFKKLREINKLRDEYIEEQAGLLSTIAEYESYCQTYGTLLSEADERLTAQNSYLFNYTGYTFKQLIDNKDNAEETKIKDWWQDEKVIEIMSSIGYLKTIISNYTTLVENSNKNLADARARYDLLTRIISSRSEDQNGERRLLLEKDELNKQFYKKYSRFLQEGSWISEDYVDDELYYLDACGIARVSAQPKVNYTIDVIELSQVEGYENYKFSVGDKTTIEDTEFFGWTLIDGLKTPRKEEVIVSETTIEFDSPERNKIKVQNYKTQFEDLFQRMAATTQSVEYNTGEYNKVTTIIEPNGTISVDTLQNSFSNNAFILSNAKDQSVIWDESGITTINLKNPSEIVRIVSGGVFVSTDGGISWNTGLTGRGINANYITSGQLDTSRINVLNGSFPSFRWDSTGISAYQFELNQETREISQFDYGKFVRLDQYGLYGINGYPNFDSSVLEDELVGEDKIWDKANFALTWKGFMLKSSHVDGGYISITSVDDFQVIDGNGKARVKIGKINDAKEEDIYGLQILNEDGPVMEHNSAGELWIKNEIKIGGDKSSVSIGYFNGFEREVIDESGEPEVDESGNPVTETIHEVINANDSFIVFDDGSIKATGGTIGDLTIDEINGISAVISNTKLTFNEKGLTVTNGGLTIENTDGTPVLVGDSSGNLIITGIINATGGSFEGTVKATDGEFTGTVVATDGSFTGTIHAKDGEFTGMIEALSGKIGGFTIENNRLVSKKNDDEEIEIILNGTDGFIYAKNIKLGEGATIENFIKLGENVQLKNVDREKSFLTVTNENGDTILNMNSSGEIQVGPDKNRIFIDGENGTIYTSNFGTGQGWKISNEASTFNDVIIRGSIKASVLEYGEVQSVGGTLLVRPSSKIKKAEQEEVAQQDEDVVEKRIKLTLESREGFQVGNICLIAEETSKTYVEIISVSAELSDNTIIIKSTKTPDFFVGKVIVNLGKTGDVGIGINGSESNSLVAPQSISVFEFNEEEKSLNPKIILGKLPDENAYGFAKGTYGLYAENVLLKGSLVTGSKEGSYSGIRTTYSEGNAPTSEKLGEHLENFTPSEILFWAGSAGDSPEQIKSSRFFIDKNGYMYAGGGYFSGSIITDSIISSSEIKTAKITGTGTNPALLIKDAAIGIDFVAIKDNVEQSVFKVSSNEITAKVNSLIFNTGFQIDNYGNTLLPSIAAVKEDKAIKISNNQIIAYAKLKTNTVNSSIDLSENFAVSFQNKEKASFILNNESATVNTDWYFSSTSVVNYGEKMRYEPVKDTNGKIIGYDLYVLEEEEITEEEITVEENE